jgi:hypothetical protein
LSHAKAHANEIKNKDLSDLIYFDHSIMFSRVCEKQAAQFAGEAFGKSVCSITLLVKFN